jgi:transcriptional regulator with XRE-family HTH domain
MGKRSDMGADLSVSRELSGLANKDVAHLLGTVPGRVSRIENGHTSPNIEELCRLSLIYGKELAELLPSVAEKVRDQLKTRLAHIPEEPTQWRHKSEQRQDTLNGLFYRLQTLSDNNWKEYEA